MVVLIPSPLRVELLPTASQAVQLIRSFLGKESSSSVGCELQNKLSSAAPSLSFNDLNYALYRCDAEERADGQGGGVYVVPRAGAMVYCGLQVRDSHSSSAPSPVPPDCTL